LATHLRDGGVPSIEEVLAEKFGPAPERPAPGTASVQAGEMLERLLRGNHRFVTGKQEHPNQAASYRRDLAAGQHPVAAILGCADSRVPPEIIFDQGLGDLFTVRVAGNVVDDATLGSLEYAVEHLGVPLIIVLGHSGCGAVQAALAGGQVRGQIHRLVTAIKPAVLSAAGAPGEPLDQAVRTNVDMVVRQLRAACPVLAPLVAQGKLVIVGAYYDIVTGSVELLTPKERLAE
jgi:carbonic anhydrase